MPASETLYFVVKIDGVYVVWEMTAEQMYAHVNTDPVYAHVNPDPALQDSLDRTPFKTRAEAEQRRKGMTGS